MSSPESSGLGQPPPHLSSTIIPDLTDKIIRPDNQYCEAGGFGDVFRCQYTNEDGVKEIAVKAFRFSFTIDEHKRDGENLKDARMIRRELGIWKRLSHRNVVPFLGIAYGFGRHGSASLVSMWMAHGTLHTFLKVHDNQLAVTHRLQLLLDVANGLQYLHSFSLVHGDLSSNNVLLDQNYNACLTDFGCASLIGELPEGFTYLKISTVGPGTLRWAAPEHFSLDEGEMKHTVKSDIYSFGNMAFLVLSGNYPWSEIRVDAAVVLRLSQGQKPCRPLARPIDDCHWAFIEQCWSSVPERPRAEDVVASLRQLLDAYPPPPPLRDLLDAPTPSSSVPDCPRNDDDVTPIASPQALSWPPSLPGASSSTLYPVPKDIPRRPDPSTSSPEQVHEPPSDEREDMGYIDVPREGTVSSDTDEAHRLPLTERKVVGNAKGEKPTHGDKDDAQKRPEHGRGGHSHSARGRGGYAYIRPSGPDSKNKVLSPFPHHEPGQQKDVCAWFVKGNCKFGHKCALAHVLPGQNMSMDRKNKKAAQLAANAPPRESRSSKGAKKDGRPSTTPHGGLSSGTVVNARTALLSGPTAPSRTTSARSSMAMTLKATPSAPAPPVKDTDFLPFLLPDDADTLEPNHITHTNANTEPVSAANQQSEDEPQQETTPSEPLSETLSPIHPRNPSPPTLPLKQCAGEGSSDSNPSAPPSDGQLPSSKWVRGTLLGTGTYGCVYLALDSSTGEMIAVKQVKKDNKDSQRHNFVAELKMERKILSGLDHPHIIAYLGSEETSTFLNILLEYVPGGTIASCLREHGKFDEDVVKSFTRQMFDGLAYLHANYVIHRNVEPGNIIVDPSGVCKISGFGNAQRADDDRASWTTTRGIVPWSAPEMITSHARKRYDYKVDVWSGGFVLLKMWAGGRPGDGNAFTSIKAMRQRDSLPLPLGVTPSDLAVDFTNRCFAIDPEERASAAELIRHPYLTLEPDWVFTGFTT